jgi:hypothetical protein
MKKIKHKKICLYPFSIFRSKAGVPILYIAFNAITLEPPSEKSKRKANRETDSRIAPSEHEHAVIKQLKVEAFGEPEVKKKKHKKLKGPLVKRFHRRRFQCETLTDRRRMPSDDNYMYSSHGLWQAELKMEAP